MTAGLRPDKSRHLVPDKSRLRRTTAAFVPDKRRLRRTTAAFVPDKRRLRTTAAPRPGPFLDVT
jgi:hypothetical protein